MIEVETTAITNTLNENNIQEVLSNQTVKSAIIANLPLTVICLIALTLFIVYIVKQTGKKTKHVKDYIETIDFGNRKYSGTIRVLVNGIEYSRGQSTCVFPINIQNKTAVLTPEQISEWFDDRRYTVREENMILEDIKYFLLENGYARHVEIWDESHNQDV